jgi:flagellar hook-associated protein 2
MVASSHTNTFTGVLDGVSITLNSVSSQPVTVSVTADNTNVVASVQALVDNYNKFRTQLNTDTAYDATTNTPAVLTGDLTTMQLDMQMSQLLTQQYGGSGSIKSLFDLGVSFDPNKTDGELTLDTTALIGTLTTNRSDVENFFTTAKTGASAQFSSLITQLAGPDNSLIANQTQSLDTTLTANQARITEMNAQLADEKTRLTNQFYQMELAVSKMQSNLDALGSIDWITGSSSTSSSSGNKVSTSSNSSSG